MHRNLALPALLLSGTLAAQTACDSIHVESVHYAPFGDGLHITLYNESMQFLSGPTLDVLDADGEILVQGVMEFFGLFTGTSLHQAHFTPQPPTPFTGTIRLNYFEQAGMVTCTFPVTNVELCPADPCSPLGVYAYQQGGPVETEFTWSVTDADNATQASGVLEMPATGFGYTVAELCLPPGEYTMHMSQAVAAGTVVQVGMTQADLTYLDGTNTQLPIGGSVDHPFTFYGPCMEGTQGIAVHQVDAPTLIVDGQVLRISTNDGSALGTLTLLDGMDRTVRSITANSSSASSDLTGLASGVYILLALDGEKPWPAQRFVLN